jgi:hypothetical protein
VAGAQDEQAWKDMIGRITSKYTSCTSDKAILRMLGADIGRNVYCLLCAVSALLS